MGSLIGSDIEFLRDAYDEALELQGIPCVYQFPLMADASAQGEPVIDSYSDERDTHILFDGNPKLKTYKRLGWVVEGDKDLPFLIHCSYHLKDLREDCIVTIAGYYAGLPARKFRVTELTCDLMCPDHMVAQVVPVYDTQVVGRTKAEIAQTFNSSHHFIKTCDDYRGHYHVTQDDVK